VAVPFTTRQRLRSAVAGMATLSALSSCVVGPNYEAPRISLTAFHSTAPDDQETSGVRPKLDSWWTDFHDSLLTQTIQEALAQNLDLAASLDRVEQARAAEADHAAVRISIAAAVADSYGNAQEITVADNLPGQAIFSRSCAGCRGSNGVSQLTPLATLTGSRAVNDPGAANALRAIFYGERDYKNMMPALGAAPSDDNIANVVNYITSRFGTKPSTLTPAAVGHGLPMNAQREPWRIKTKIRWSRHMDAKEKFQQIRYKEIASTILLTAE
jgi:mono/diheme cytochrome c family protein